MMSLIVLTPKRTILGRNHVIWAINCENRSRSSSWACEREKKDRIGQDRTGKKSQKGYISPICGEAPTEAMYMKICVVGDVVDVITCAKFQNKIFRGYDFTGGRIFHFSYWFWMCLPTVQRALLRCLWLIYVLAVLAVKSLLCSLHDIDMIWLLAFSILNTSRPMCYQLYEDGEAWNQQWRGDKVYICLLQGGIWRGDGGTCPGHWTSRSPSLELIQTSLGGTHLIPSLE